MATEPPSPLAAGPQDTPRLARVWRLLVGAPRSLADRSLFHRLSLVPFLAWVGLGADGLSSSAYGPEEAFRSLGAHGYLTVGLALMMVTTILVISAAYSRIIEEFPHGGGGYVVATELLGAHAGVVSGSALLVDYVLTIAISIAAAGDALFSLLPLSAHIARLPVEVALIALLVATNLRGVRESVLVLAPVFVLFLVTHAFLIVGGIAFQAGALGSTAARVGGEFQGGAATLGGAGMLMLLVRAYSLGGGTYTGIEAVSNGLAIMREPRVQTARRTMLYMGLSLAFTATGLLVCYLLWQVEPATGKTLNAVLAERVFDGLPLAASLIVATLVAEGALLVVAAQAGFVDGPRVLANMAVDSWMPHRFSALSDRLTTQNGIVLMGAASLVALLYTGGDVRQLVVMYAINVFATFSLSLLGMTLSRVRRGPRGVRRRGGLPLFALGFVACATVLATTIVEKFAEGGWITLAVTGSVVATAFLVRRHYRRVGAALTRLYADLDVVPSRAVAEPGPLDPTRPVAAVLVASYGGLGIHTALNVFRTFPGHFAGLVFLSVGVIDSAGFKGAHALDDLREQTEASLQHYVALARRLGVPAAYRFALGTDAVAEAEALCLEVVRDFPRATFFAGKVIFERERWYQRLLHNETAFAIQKRLQWAGQTMVILPAKVPAAR